MQEQLAPDALTAVGDDQFDAGVAAGPTCRSAVWRERWHSTGFTNLLEPCHISVELRMGSPVTARWMCRLGGCMTSTPLRDGS